MLLVQCVFIFKTEKAVNKKLTRLVIILCRVWF